jgi:ArsR family transcriptional regulator
MPQKSCCRLVNKTEKLRVITIFLNVISETNRLNILRILRTQKLSVAEIWQFLDLPQNLVSHHLKVLKAFGLLNSERKGKQIIYSLNKDVIKRYKALLIKFI